MSVVFNVPFMAKPNSLFLVVVVFLLGQINAVFWHSCRPIYTALDKAEIPVRRRLHAVEVPITAGLPKPPAVVLEVFFTGLKLACVA